MQDKQMCVPVIIYASYRAIDKYGDEAERIGALYTTSNDDQLLWKVAELLDL